MPKLTKKQKNEILQKCDYEGGIPDTLINYSNFSEYDDEEFNTLVERFGDIYKEIEDYLEADTYDGAVEDDDSE